MIPSVLTPEIAAIGIGLGLMFSLICYLTTNLSPGGMITLAGWRSPSSRTCSAPRSSSA